MNMNLYRTNRTKNRIVREERLFVTEDPEGEPVRVPYTLSRSARRTTWSLVISAEGKLTLHVPLRAAERDIDRILAERSSWILTNLQRMEDRMRERESLRPSLTPEERARTIRNAVRLLRPVLAERIAYYEPLLPSRHRPITRVSVRAQKTRWGSCSSKGTLSFNWKLYLAPPEVLDYVVVHELCHLCEMNHQKPFWDLVASILPDYEASRRWLCENGDTLDV